MTFRVLPVVVFAAALWLCAAASAVIVDCRGYQIRTQHATKKDGIEKMAAEGESFINEARQLAPQAKEGISSARQKFVDMKQEYFGLSTPKRRLLSDADTYDYSEASRIYSNLQHNSLSHMEEGIENLRAEFKGVTGDTDADYCLSSEAHRHAEGLPWHVKHYIEEADKLTRLCEKLLETVRPIA